MREAEKTEEKALAKALRARAAERDEVQAFAEGAGKSTPARPSRQNRHWYTRALMWHFARADHDEAHGGHLGSIAELAAEEYKLCLDKVNRHLKCHKMCREVPGEEFVEKDRGPISAGDQGLGVRALGSTCAPALEDYNGVGGGKVHRYYRREVFDAELARRGVDRSTCNERL